MKRIILLFLIGLLLAGCSSKDETIVDINLEDISLNLNGTVSVYYVGEGSSYGTSFYDTAIKNFERTYYNCKIEVTSFTSDEEMRLKIASEVGSKNGADVFLIDRSNKIDLFKMANNGGFMDLTPLLEQDETFNREEYYEMVLDAGLFNGKQYIMPLGFTFPYFQTTEEGLERDGVTALLNPYSFEDLATILMSKTEEYKDEPNKNVYIDHNKLAFPVLPTFLLMSGIQPIDYAKKSTDFDTEGFRYICELAKSLHQEAGKREAARNTPIKDAQSFIRVSLDTLFFFTAESPITTMYYNIATDRSILNETSKFLTIPMYASEDASINAIVTCSAMINKDSQNPVGAYWFVQQLMTSLPYMENNLALNNQLFIKKSNTESSMNYYALSSTYTNGGITYFPLFEESTETLRNQIDSIKNVSIVNAYTDVMIEECMLPYLEGVKSYDECLSVLKSRINLYLSE